MNGLAMLAKQLAPSLDIPGLLKQFEVLKKELPNFARGVKDTVDSTDKRIAALQTSVDSLHVKMDYLTDIVLQVLATAKDPHVYPAGASREPDDKDRPYERPYNNGAAV